MSHNQHTDPICGDAKQTIWCAPLPFTGSGQGGDDLGFDGGVNGSGGSTGSSMGCASGPNDDKDKDGWTVERLAP